MSDGIPPRLFYGGRTTYVVNTSLPMELNSTSTSSNGLDYYSSSSDESWSYGMHVRKKFRSGSITSTTTTEEDEDMNFPNLAYIFVIPPQRLLSK